MKTRFINHQGQHLIIYFAGWGTPPSVVTHLQLPSNTDLLICYQYHDLVCDIDFKPYQSIRVVAWSLGVWVAERVMQNTTLLSATAINGSGLPCHNQYGIPTEIFQGTLDKLSPQTRTHFERRMCMDKSLLADYQQHIDYQAFEDIQTELHYLNHAIKQDTRHNLITWDKAIISQKDSIFPPDNLRHYWQTRCPIEEYPYAHLLFQHFTHWAEFWEGKHD